MTELNNQKNSYGFKDCGDCYRDNGKFIQWVDCNKEYRQEIKQWAKNNNLQYKITSIGQGMIRLFIDSNWGNDNLTELNIYNGQ